MKALNSKLSTRLNYGKIVFEKTEVSKDMNVKGGTY
jgi:hypothetical protein